MWVTAALEFEPVKAAELALLSSDVRGDVDRLLRLLSPDFAEIGRSGRRWTRADIVESLLNEEPRHTPDTSDWMFNRLSGEIVLVQYTVHSAGSQSRHTSLWNFEGPVLHFHQGTPVTSG